MPETNTNTISDTNNNTYINELEHKLNNKRKRKIISEELYSHIQDKTDYYIELGYDEETAIQKATEDMGNAEETAIQLDGLYKTKWKDNPINFVALIFFVSQIICVLFFFKNFQYATKGYTVAHNVITDFISLGIFIATLYFIYKGRKKHLLPLLFMSAVAVIINLFLHTYHPMIYAVCSIFTKGISWYYNQIFAYDFTPFEVQDTIVNTGIIIAGITLIFAGISILYIFATERGLITKGLSKSIRIVEKTTAVILFINLLIMTGFTTTAYIRTESDTARINESYNDIIDLIMDTDVNDSYNNVIDSFEYKGYTFDNINLGEENPFKVSQYTKDNIDFQIVYDTNTKSIALTLYRKNYKENNPKNAYINRLTLKDFENIEEGCTLDDFLKTGLQYNADFLLKDKYGEVFNVDDTENSDIDELVKFTFNIDDKEADNLIIGFINGKLFSKKTNIELEDDYNKQMEEFQQDNVDNTETATNYFGYE